MDDIKDIMSIGKMAMGMFSSGGSVDDLGYIIRQHHADGERVVAEEPGLVPPAEIPEDYDTRLAKTMQAIKRIESGGRSDALGPATRTGDRAHGLYQVMGANIPSWTEEALGRRLTPEEFLKDEKAQEETAKHRMGLYLKKYNDPAQVASMWFSGRPMEKAGDAADVTGTTVPRYISMFNKYYGGAESPDMPSRGAKEAQYREEPKEGGLSLKGIGDTVTSDKFLVPFLSFVGSTLASQRPTLGGALGEGIVGGVSGYQQNKKMQSELAKGVLDIVKDRFNITTDPKSGQTIYFNKSTGKTVSAPEYWNAVGGIADSLGVPRGVLGIPTTGIDVPKVGGAPAGTPTQPGEFSRPGQEAIKAGKSGQAEVAGGEKKETAPEITDTRKMAPSQLYDYAVKNKEKFKLINERDPDILMNEADEYKRIANSYRLEGKTAEAAAMDQRAKETLDNRKQYINDAISLEVEGNKQIQTAKNESANKTYDKAVSRVDAYEVDKALLTRTSQALHDYRAGRLSDARATIGDVAGTLGIPLPKGFFNADLNDELVKLALTQVVDQVAERQLGRAPGTAMKTLEQTVAGPKLSPGAAFALVGRTMGDLDYQHDKDRAYIKKGRGTDYGEHAIDWKEKSNINDYYRKAYGSIPEPKGMEDSMRRSLQKSYGYEPRVLSSTEAPAAGARTSPGIVPEQAAPVRVNSLDEAWKLGKGTKFIDPNGVLREVP
jgi:tetratricopeptide (TPR) repeat protein